MRHPLPDIVPQPLDLSVLHLSDIKNVEVCEVAAVEHDANPQHILHQHVSGRSKRDASVNTAHRR